MPTSHRYIVAADGRRVRIYEQLRSGAALNLVDSIDFAAEDERPPRDRPSRVHESATPMRHGSESGRTPHEEEEARFLARVAGDLAARRAQHKFERMILFAPPRALGILRDAFKGDLANAVEASIDADVVAETGAQLHERMRAAGLR